jgi:serine protease AprX
MYRSALTILGVLLAVSGPSLAVAQGQTRLDPALRTRARAADRLVQVIVRTDDVPRVERLVANLGGLTGIRLPSINAVVARLPESGLDVLADTPGVRAVSLDRPIHGTLDRTASAIGARWVAENLGLDGTGIGIATIDSGVTRAHDDLGPGRIVHFVDFVRFRTQPYDGYGHGTHVAGIIAGNGYHSDGARRGVAPGAHLVVLKALDENGEGYISNAIAALDYAVEHRAAYNIRAINLSVAAGVYESYKSDPLTQAAARAVEAGIVVVTAAGNLGRNARGLVQHGGITAPGNAPWVLTVGASTHNGTIDRRDDRVASFSSRGPGAIDRVAKPDLVAPGVGIESLAETGSTLFAARPDARLWGTVPAQAPAYLSLSGTSMAAPVVTGTVALVLEANPSLTPAQVKAVLKASSEPHPNEEAMAQGAGFLNAKAAVELARSFDQSAAAAFLEDLVAAYEPEEGVWALSCDAEPGDCSDPSLDCAATAACFGSELAGDVMVGVDAPSAETVVWHRRPAPVRRGRESDEQGH